jgi:hypothetical protein
MSDQDSLFEQAVGETVAPPRVVKLPVSSWRSAYEGKPEVDISVGLRLPSQDETEGIEREALRTMRENLGADTDKAFAIQSYQEAKLVNLVATCICDTDDVSACHPLFETPNATLPLVLTKEGLRYLFDQIERLQIDSSPIFPEASDTDVDALMELIRDGALPRLSSTNPIDHARCRRYLALCLEMMI